MNANETRLDELDVKFFKELPFLVEVFASSFNKLKQIVSGHFKQVEDEITNFIKNNSNWKKAYNNVSFWPFYSGRNLKPDFIRSMSDEFGLDIYIKIKETANEATTKSFFVACGLWYSKEDKNRDDNKPYLYIGIYRDKVEQEGQMLSLKFYENLDVANYRRFIYHPSNEDGEETFYIRTFKITVEELNKMFQLFSKQVLQPFLKELERVYKKKQKIKR